MNKTQVQTTGAALVAGLAGYAAGHGWLGLDTTAWSAVFGAVVTAAVAIWPAVATRAQSLKDTVGGLRNTTVVTDAASANALPDNRDVVATTPAIAAAIRQAQ